MADINLNSAPYHDRFKEGSDIAKVLFRPDRPLQQAELNEQQSIAEDNLKRIGNSLFEDGAMQTGMSFKINDDNTITVEDGLVYLGGKIHQFYEQTVPFTGNGKEVLGVKVDSAIITHNEDPDLLDQTQGVDSYLSAGADRLEETVILTVNDESAPVIYEFDDGNLELDPDRPEFSKINEVLAQRTHEESGSYQVEGFSMYTEEHPTDNTKLKLVIDPGIAYVLGYRISKPTATRIDVRKSQTTKEVISETHTYDTSERRNRVGSLYVDNISQVLSRTDSPAGGIQVKKGVADGRDSLPAEYTAIDPNTVTLWTSSTNYTLNNDFTLTQESGVTYINWDTGLNGQEPTEGSTYNISFEYDRVMKKGEDFKVTTEPTGANEPGWITYIDYNGMTGLKPKDGGTERVDYTFFLAREDIVTLNSAGDFTITEGQPARTKSASAPGHADPKTLKIGNVFVFPNSVMAEADNNGVARLRMVDLQRIKRRLEDVEYNQTILALENEHTAQDDALTLRGVFTDPFVDFSRMDLELSSVALSFEDAHITLMTNSPNEQRKVPEFLEGTSTAQTWGRVVTAPFTENREIYQPQATEAMNVNPYAVYNKLGVLNLNPSSDNWIEEEKVTINEEEAETIRLDRWWSHNREETIHKDLREKVSRLELDGNQTWEGNTVREDVRKGRTGTITDVAQNVREKSIEFIRQKDVSFTADNLQPNANNLYISFDGQRVPVTATGNTVTGAETGTIMADSEGKASGTFTIPPGVRTGTREVSLQNDTNSAITTYRAQGTQRTTEETITTTRVTVRLYDPLAQSFAFPQDRVVSSFDLYFASKSNTDNLIVQVRGLSEGGMPNQTIHAERIVKPSEINVSEDGSVATNVKLDDPLMADANTSYCVVMITDSNEYTMWISTLGQNLINDPSTKATTQPYVNGVLFSSSNARTWTAHQNSDLKFGVYTAEFNEEAVVEFGTMENLDSDMMLLMADFLTPSNTGCKWEIKAVSKQNVGTISIGDVPWQPILNYVEELPEGTVIGLVQLRATFKSSRYISPMLSLDSLVFANFISETEGDYVTLNVDSSEAPYNTVKLAFDAHTPNGTSITPKYSTDGGDTWNTFTDAPDRDRKSAEFSRLTYQERVSSEATNTQIKFKLELQSDNRFVRPRAKQFAASFKDEM